MKNIPAHVLAGGKGSGFVCPERGHASGCIYLFNASDIIYIRIYG
ncbi:MAG: hypothetical protein WAV13_15370 [Thermodesulfovibrionales bacterium]